MRQETQLFLSDLAITRDGDFRDMFVSTTTFVNAELAGLYGLPAPAGTGFAAATLPDSGLRAGYLGQGSFLALNAHSSTTSPTYRGKFIREMLMCESIPPPPMNVPPLPADMPGAAPQTMRQKLAVHRAVEPCKTCHTLMDPIGLAFENFDGIGSARTMDAGQVIDASGDLDGMAFAGPRELEKLLSQTRRRWRASRATSIVTSRATSRARRGAGHHAALKAFSDGQFHFSALINAMLTSAGFTTAAPPSNAPIATGTGGAGGGRWRLDGAGGAGASGTGRRRGRGGQRAHGAAQLRHEHRANHRQQVLALPHDAGGGWRQHQLDLRHARHERAVTHAATKGCVFLVAPSGASCRAIPTTACSTSRSPRTCTRPWRTTAGSPCRKPTSGKTMTTARGRHDLRLGQGRRDP